MSVDFSDAYDNANPGKAIQQLILPHYPKVFAVLFSVCPNTSWYLLALNPVRLCPPMARLPETGFAQLHMKSFAISRFAASKHVSTEQPKRLATLFFIKYHLCETPLSLTFSKHPWLPAERTAEHSSLWLLRWSNNCIGHQKMI